MTRKTLAIIAKISSCFLPALVRTVTSLYLKVILQPPHPIRPSRFFLTVDRSSVLSIRTALIGQPLAPNQNIAKGYYNVGPQLPRFGG